MVLLSVIQCQANGRTFRTELTVAIPALQFDHPYRGRVIEKYVPLRTARRICSGHDACNYLRRGTCHIVIPYQSQAPVHNRAAYRRWEEAGCNGQPDAVIFAHPNRR
jgi:hypothetical protein